MLHTSTCTYKIQIQALNRFKKVVQVKALHNFVLLVNHSDLGALESIFVTSVWIRENFLIVRMRMRALSLLLVLVRIPFVDNQPAVYNEM